MVSLSNRFFIATTFASAVLYAYGASVYVEEFTSPLDVNQDGSNYVWYTSKSTVADDGTLTIQSNGTCTHDIRPYQKTTSHGVADRVKSIIFEKDYWNVTQGEILTCEVKMWSKQWNTAFHPFGEEAVTNPTNDIRLGTCGLFMMDPQSWTIAEFLQTDQENQPYHARLGIGQNKSGGTLGDYHSFNTLKLGVSERISPYTYSILTIQYDRTEGTLAWLVDGMKVHMVTTIGMPTLDMIKLADIGGGSTSHPISPKGFMCGFGCINFLDFVDPLNPSNQQGLVQLVDVPDFYTLPTSFVDPANKPSNRLFGQGSYANYEYLKVDITNKLAMNPSSNACLK